MHAPFVRDDRPLEASLPAPGGATVTASGVEAELIDLLLVFLIAAGVGVAVAKLGRFPYTIALLIAGFVAGLLGLGSSIDIELTHDVIILVLLPPLLFQGAATTDLEEFRENLPYTIVLAVAGLGLSILIVAWGMVTLFGWPWLIALLFATVALPTDPVAVLALFEELGAPERLSVLVEGESLLNDGVAVVVFGLLLDQVPENLGSDPDPSAVEGALSAVATPTGVAELFAEIAVTSVGGAIIGFAAGFAVYSVMRNLDEHMTEIVLTAVLAYGSFILAEHVVAIGDIHFSGVIATVVAGLFVGNRGADTAMSPRTRLSIFNTWETAAFIVNTFIFVVIGVTTPLGAIASRWEVLVPAIGLVLGGRALAVYPLSAVANRLVPHEVSLSYQHVLVWGGLHASIPIALVLGVPDSVPMSEDLRVLVFGIAAFSLVVQGLTIGNLIERLGITTVSEEQRLYELLVGRARAVDAALESAQELYDEGEIPTRVYEQFREEYGREKDELKAAIARLLDEHPEIRASRQLAGERQVLSRERSAIQSAELDGVVGNEVADDLLEEVEIKLDLITEGESTVESGETEGYEEFWRSRARQYGVLDEDDAE
jgi:CPA1 family monovalent cation:H+ antiporter